MSPIRSTWRVLERAGKGLWAWFFDRVGLDRIEEWILEHKVPAEIATRKGWAYVFGSSTLTAFILQIVTGITLATVYVPSAEHAYDTLVAITEDVAAGAWVRGMHFYGASAMAILIVLHTTRTFLTGSYKFPREASWLSGLVLLFLVFGMLFTGQLLRWDEDGFWTVVVGAFWAGQVPLVGEELAEFLLAGDTVGAKTLTRFYVLHVLVFPLLLLGFIAFHLRLVFKNGISELPRAGRPVDPRTYREEYKKLEENGRRYFPDTAWREGVASGLVVLSVVAIGYFAGPHGPGAPPDPTRLIANPQPDWYLRWYYALLYIHPRGWATFTMVYAPLLVGLMLFLLPLVSPAGERAPSKRPWAVAVVGASYLALGYLVILGMRAPWVPDEDAALPPLEHFGTPTEPVRAGAEAFDERGCFVCHQVHDTGGRWGPDLTDVTSRIPSGELTTIILNGRDAMPGYRGVITQGELEAIIAFLTFVDRNASSTYIRRGTP